jgi:hypothetical protein
MKTALRSWPLMAIALVALALFGCSTGSDPETSTPGSLLLSRPAIAVTAGMSATVTVRSVDGAVASGTYSAASGNESTASAVINGSAVTVTGKAVGTCSVRIANAAGDYSDLAVEVYDPATMDAGDLRLAVVDEFTLAADRASAVGMCIWNPVAPNGYYALGGYMTVGSTATNPSGSAAVLVVKDISAAQNALAVAASWNSTTNCLSVFSAHPIAGDGYAALGRYCILFGSSSPSITGVCVRKDLAVSGSISTILKQFTSGPNSWYWCGIEQPNSSGHDGCYLAPGTFAHYYLLNNAGATTDDGANNVLCVDLQRVGASATQSYVPKLTSYESPPAETPELFSRAVLIPCTAITDSAKSVSWQVANSPFYLLERRVFYKPLYFNYNQTSTEQSNSVTISSGVESSKSTAFHTNTGVSISAEAGIELYAVSAKVTTTLSVEMGYETSSSVTELSEKSVATSINTPAGKAVACWQKFNRYTLYRHDGTSLEAVASWDIGIDNYVTDEYPD